MEIIGTSCLLLAFKYNLYSMCKLSELSLFLHSSIFFQLVIPFASPVSLRALFSPKPFRPNYQLNEKDVSEHDFLI